jgi:hypothetical protein
MTFNLINIFTNKKTKIITEKECKVIIIKELKLFQLRQKGKRDNVISRRTIS